MKIRGILKSGFALSGQVNVQITHDWVGQPSYREINQFFEGLNGKPVLMTVEAVQ